MERVTGVGGVFLRSHDPKRLTDWYAQHLGIPMKPWGAKFSWSDEVPTGTGATAWSVLPEDTKYFSVSEGMPATPAGADHTQQHPSDAAQQVMINYRVDDLAALLGELRAAGVWIDPKQTPDEGFGTFAWIQDCDGNRVELWQPAAPKVTV